MSQLNITFHKSLLVTIIMLMGILMVPSGTHAQNLNFPSRTESNLLHCYQMRNGQPNIMYIRNHLRSTMVASGTFFNQVKFKSNNTYVKFYVNHDADTLPQTSYVYKLMYRLDWSTSKTDTNYNGYAIDSLVIGYNPDSLSAFQDVQAKLYAGLYNAKLEILQIYDLASGTPVLLTDYHKKNFAIELGMQYQVYLKTHYAPNDMGIAVSNSVYDSVRQQLRLNWDPTSFPTITGKVLPMQYELEWTYCDNYGKPDSAALSTTDVRYDFQNNATRVTVDENSYVIPVVYTSGYIVYRVRMVRPDSVYYKYPVYGIWSLANTSGTINSINSINYKQINAHMGDKVNWNYTINFAEGGKYKHVLGYFDGLLKNRQTITRFNTNSNQLLVTENIYDYEGRPAITTIPSVVDTNNFRYLNGVSISDSTHQIYSAVDFDRKPGICPDEVAIPGFTESSLANRYYSALNPDKSGMQKFVPRAEGFPFVHTQLSPGYQTRVDRQGGVGPAMQIARGHDNQFDYVGAEQSELNRLLGINAGFKNFYSKVISTDQNGQLSQTIKDYRGRQVASSLVGASVDTSQVAIMFNDEVPNDQRVRDDRLSNTTQLTVGHQRRYNGNYFMDAEALVNVAYEYTFLPFEVCRSPYVGLSVQGKYEYSITDKCGEVKIYKEGVTGTTGAVGSSVPLTSTESTDTVLAKGPYTVDKTLTIVTDDIYAAVDSFFVHQPNCLLTEDDFIKREVENTPFPCPKEEGPCDKLKREMMEELFPGAKYGRYQPFRPLTGINPSIFDIVHSDTGKYRYMSHCVAADLNSISITRFARTYTALANLPVDTFLWLYENAGPDKYRIAEQLLPLHPEYCRLQGCFDDTLEKRLYAIPDGATARSYQLFYLDDLVRQDTQLRRKLLLSPFNMAHIEDSLKTMFGGMFRIDSLAAEAAFCLNDNAMAYSEAKNVFRNQIATLNFPSLAVEDVYFQQLRNLYLSNREKYKIIAQTGGGDHCPPCDTPYRMTLLPPPLVPVVYNNNGSFNTTGNNGLLGVFGSSTMGNMAAFLNMVPGNITNPAIIQALQDSAARMMRRHDSLLNYVSLDSIMSRLGNCYTNPTAGSRLRDSLVALIIRGEVRNGTFQPGQVRNAITGAGLNLTDLCHPYLPSYDYFDDGLGKKGTCAPMDFYESARDFFNEPYMINVLKGTTTTSSLSSLGGWNNSNAFAARISSAISSGSGMQVVSRYDAADKLYELVFLRTGSTDSLKIALQSPTDVTVGGTAYPLFQTAGTLVFDRVSCYYDDPQASADGYIGRFMFHAKVSRTDGSQVTTVRVTGWNSAKIQMNEMEGQNPIAKCVPCTGFKTVYKEFADSMSAYGGYGADHPLFYRSLRNFMNINLQKVYTQQQYEDFLQSCALADSMVIPMYGGYGRGSLPSLFYTNFAQFSAAVQATLSFTPRAELLYNDAGVEEFIIDYRSVPFSRLRLFNEQFMLQRANGVLKTAVTNQVGRLWIPQPVANGIELTDAVDGSGLSSLAAQSVVFDLGGISEPGYYYDLFYNGSPGNHDLNIAIARLTQNLVDRNVVAYWAPMRLSTVNQDYFKPEKQQLLAYTYAMQHLGSPKVLDTLQDYFLKTNISAFTGQEVSYNNPLNPNRFTDLYHNSSSHVFPGYTKLNQVLAGVKTALGSSRLFLPANVSAFPTSPTNPSLKIFRCSDGLYWYRYFDTDRKLYNVYVRIPAFVHENAHQQYLMVGMHPSNGDSASRRFTLALRSSGGDTIYAKGSTDFDIAWSNKLSNVLLGNEDNYNYGTPLSGEPGGPDNCEQQRVTNAIYSGKVLYVNYVDSMRISLRATFYAHVMGQVKEKLWVEYIDKRFATTLYSYDLAGNLMMTVPPLGVKKLDSAIANTVDALRLADSVDVRTIPAHTKVTRYEYNTANKPIREVTPDGGHKALFYDQKGNVILSQSEKQRTKGLYTYMLYDVQNRVTETGEVLWMECGPFADMKMYVPGPGGLEFVPSPSTCACPDYRDSVWRYCMPGTDKWIDNSTIVGLVHSKPRSQVVSTIYDTVFADLSLEPGLSAQNNLRGRISANLYYADCIPGKPGLSRYNHATHYSYDIAGNVQTLVQDFPDLALARQRYKRIDYEYDLLSGKVNMIAYNRSFADQFYQRYAYDADNRITQVETSHDGFIWKRDAEYTYYKHGPLARVSLGNNRVQGIDYAYTIQGWLKSINGDRIDTTADMGGDGSRSNNRIIPKDAYATAIDYFTDDYKPIGTAPVATLPNSVKGLYNGNIARQTNDIAPFGALTTAYTYDQMNRLRNARYATRDNNNALNFNNWYASAYKYDLDGNITQLSRRDNQGTLMDNMHYRYPNAGNNRLADVLDSATYSNPGVQDIGHYTASGMSRMLYDGDGNVVKDLVSALDTIKWNIYGKATDMQDTGRKLNLSFTYDGAGQRVSKKRTFRFVGGYVDIATYYVRDASGNILAEYNSNKEFIGDDASVTVVRDLRMGVNNVDWIRAITNTSMHSSPIFSAYLIEQHGTATPHSAGFYLYNDASITQHILENQEEFWPVLNQYSTATGRYPITGVLLEGIRSHGVDEIINSISNTLFSNPDLPVLRHSLAQLAQTIPPMYNYFMEGYGIDSIGNATDSANVAGYMEEIAVGSPHLYGELIREHFHQSEDNSESIRSWLNSITADPAYQTEYFQSVGLKGMFREMLLNYGQAAAEFESEEFDGDATQAGLYGFASWWPDGLAAVKSVVSEQDMERISYYSDPYSYLLAVANNGGLEDIDTALTMSPEFNIDGLAYAMGMKPGQVMEKTFNQKEHNLALASHHIYGSSRLGVTTYLPNQYNSNWNYVTKQTDTVRLNAAETWYHYGLNDLVGKRETDAYGNVFTSGSTVAQHVIGQKQYELTNHLGNVQATVSDKRFSKDENNDGLRDDFKAAIPSAYDYYPYGMPMPGRTVYDTGRRCITVMQMRQVPQETLTNIPLTGLTAIGGSFIMPSYSLGAAPTAHGLGGGMSKVISVTPGVPVTILADIGYLYSYVRLSVHDAASGFLTHGSINFPGTVRLTFTPVSSSITLSVNIMANYVSAPTNGLFTLTGLNVSRMGYRSEPTIVQLCDDEKDKYQFGFNGQMKVNEVAGMGNWNTAEFWEYDTRTATRKNRDPVKHPNESPYLVFHNNPICYSDPFGDDPPEGFKKINSQIGDLYVPQSTKTNYGNSEDLNSFVIGNKTFASECDNQGNVIGYFSGGDKYENPDISLQSGEIRGNQLDATFTVSGVPASGLQFIQTLKSGGMDETYKGKKVAGVQYDANGMIPGSYFYNEGNVNMQGSVDAAAGSAYAKTINDNTGKPNGESFPGKPYYYSQAEQNAQTTWAKNTGTIRVYDQPNRQYFTSVCNFTTIIVARNYMGSGIDVALGTFKWGWTNQGANATGGLSLKGNVPSTVDMNIINKFYKSYKLFK